MRELAAAGRLPPLVQLTDWTSFAELDRSVGFPVAGSFVGFLIETGGLDAFKQLYPRHGRSSSREILDERLLDLRVIGTWVGGHRVFEPDNTH